MLFSTSTVLSAMLAMAPLTQAHMVLVNPKPYGNPNTSPLDAGGADFPCKTTAYTGVPATEWTVGSNGSFELFNSVVHGGGSCQVSVTTDKAPTKASKWKVIHSFEGGCPVPPTTGGNKPNGDTSNAPFSFLIPPELLDGEYTMSWIWFNKVGNREAYMNCAPVKVSGSKSTDKAAFEALPDMAVANIGGQGDCKTKEGNDYTFAKPGKYVTRSNAPSTGPWMELCGGPASGNAPVPGGSGNGGNTGGSPPAAPAPANPGAPSQAPPAAASSPPAALPPAASAPAPPAPAPFAPAGGLTSTLRTIITVTAPSGPAPSSKKDAASAPPAAKPTSPGSQPPAAAPSAAPSQAPAAPGTGSGASCSPDGSIVCSADGKQFAICNWGKAVFQAVAAGTTCSNGKIAKRADYVSTLRTVYA